MGFTDMEGASAWVSLIPALLSLILHANLIPFIILTVLIYPSINPHLSIPQLIPIVSIPQLIPNIFPGMTSRLWMKPEFPRKAWSHSVPKIIPNLGFI